MHAWHSVLAPMTVISKGTEEQSIGSNPAEGKNEKCPQFGHLPQKVKKEEGRSKGKNQQMENTK